MKTLKKILLIATLSCTGITTAQTYYYNTSQTFYGNRYSPGTYVCTTTNWGYVTLHNQKNIYTDADYVYKDGSTITNTDILRGYIPLVEDDNWTKQKCMSIVDGAFSAEEKARINGESFDVSMTIDPSTGKVIEVDFRFYKDRVFATVPVTTYRKIEKNLKEQVWFTITPTGKQLKFIQRGWMHEVE